MKELTQKIIDRLDSSKLPKDPKQLDKAIKQEFEVEGVKLDLRKVNHYQHITNVKIGLLRKEGNAQRYRLKVWSDVSQCYEFVTTWTDKGYKVGDILWVSNRRYEVLEVLE